jgi:hypothetical protein
MHKHLLKYEFDIPDFKFHDLQKLQCCHMVPISKITQFFEGVDLLM